MTWLNEMQMTQVVADEKLRGRRREKATMGKANLGALRYLVHVLMSWLF